MALKARGLWGSCAQARRPVTLPCGGSAGAATYQHHPPWPENPSLALSHPQVVVVVVVVVVAVVMVVMVAVVMVAVVMVVMVVE